jgi:2,3-bisphosphoglycerate-independent phosphoglycerate mutase
MRQLTGVLAPQVARYTCLTEYDESWSYPVAFLPDRPTVTIAAVIAKAGRPPAPRRRDGEVPARDVLLQRRGGGARTTGERRELVPSPRDVPTYDHKPEMSAREAAAAFVAAWREDAPRFAIINFANPTWSATRASSRRP